MDSTNVETITESPTEPEPPADVSIAKLLLDVYISLDSKLTNNKTQTTFAYVLAERTRSREVGRGEAEGKVPTGDGRVRSTRGSLSLPSEATAKGSKVFRLG